jgi:hypothetical protein
MMTMNNLLNKSFVLLLVVLHYNACGQEGPVYKTNEQISQLLCDNSAKNYSLSTAAWDYSFIGEYQKSLITYDKDEDKANEKPHRDSLNAGLSNHRPGPALDYIVDRSALEQVIIINEAHHQPLHRVFTESLLEGLYKNGYRYLGLEALAEDSPINIRKWPMINDGFYTREPQFGNMLRRALDIGFKLFGYEAIGDAEGRETGQAKKIKKIIDKDPKAKILIHCGFGHLLEDHAATRSGMMAAALRKISDIDPFTIDQVDWTERSDPEHERKYYENTQVGYSAVFVDPTGKPYNRRMDSGQVDLKIAHPRTSYTSGRPTWLLRNNTWKVYGLNKIKFDVKFPCLVAAYPAKEGDGESVPVDQIEITTPNEKALILPPGSFILRITDKFNKMQQVKIVVP